MRRGIPEAVRHVILSNRNTWENTTLEEWVNKRLELLQKLEHSDRLRTHWAKYFRAYSETCQRVREEDKEAGGESQDPLIIEKERLPPLRKAKETAALNIRRKQGINFKGFKKNTDPCTPAEYIQYQRVS